MRASTLPLSVPCGRCRAPARLKQISAYPFTRGVTEATYECAACGGGMTRAIHNSEAAHAEPAL